MMATSLRRVSSYLIRQGPASLASSCRGGDCRYKSSGSEASKVSGSTGSVVAASAKDNLPQEAVFYHSKHDMYVCWHPEVPFPYEMSKPIPLDAASTESNLKIPALVPVREIFRKKDKRLVIRELMQLTYTPKYNWIGKFGRKIKWVRKDADPLKQKRNREYL